MLEEQHLSKDKSTVDVPADHSGQVSVIDIVSAVHT